MKKFLVLIPIGVLALVLAFAANSASIAATGTVTGAGALSIVAPTTATWSDTLDGDDDAVTYSYPLNIVDARGSGAGWNITASSTVYTSGTHTIPAGTITAVASACAGNTCTVPTNAITYPITLSATANKIFNAAANTGLGKFTITPTAGVTIPGNSFAGTYTATVTLALVTGP